MGLYLSMIKGPVVIAKCTLKDVVNPYRACGKELCNRFKKKQEGRFCNLCGAAIETFRDKTKKALSPTHNDVYVALEAAGLREDSLFLNNFVSVGEGFQFIQLTKDSPFNTDPEMNHGDDFSEEITPQDITEQLAWYTENCAKELEVIRSLYESFELKWMVVCYYS